MPVKVTSVRVLDDFKLDLEFDNGFAAIVDLQDLAGRGVMVAWLKRQVFERVSISPAGALTWPGDIDIDGDTLYLRASGKNPEDLYPAPSIKPL